MTGFSDERNEQGSEHADRSDRAQPNGGDPFSIMRRDAVVSRREALRFGAVGLGAAVAGPMILSACGGTTGGNATSGASSSTATSTASETSAKLPPFNPNAPAGGAPSLPERVGYPNPINAPLFSLVGKYLNEACDDRGIGYVTAQSNGDPEQEVQQTEGFFQRGIGALFETPVNIPATDPQMQKAIEMGALSVGVQRPYCHTQVSVNQYDIGYGQGTAAVEWIKENLGGQAQVAYFNNDALEPLIPRHHGVLDALKKGGSGIDVVSDITAPASTEEAASQMSALLQAHPDVKVVLGDAPTIEGVFTAFKALGRSEDPDVYISSCAGTDPDYELIKAGTIYKATSAEPWNGWAYCIGQFAADWFEGKSIPRGISASGGTEPMLTTAAAVSNFQRFMDDPRALWNDKSALAKYISFFGNISYSTRNNWWREVWTP